MLIVNLFGGPGSGKSTLAMLVAGFLKTRHPHISVECPGEFAKEVVYEGALKALNAQLYISGRQWWRIAQCAGHADIVVTDSPVLMSPVYGKLCDPPTPDAFDDVCRFHHNQFHTLNYLVLRKHAFESKARAHGEAEADRLSRLIAQHITDEEVDYQIVHSTEQNAGLIAQIAANKATQLKNTNDI